MTRRHNAASTPSRAPVAAVVGLATALVVLLATGSREPSQFVWGGVDGPARDLIVQDFGEDALIEREGYDGQQTYAIARHFPDIHAAEPHLDSAHYRLMRILPPALASPAPAGTPTVIALLVLNVIGVGAAVHGIDRLLGGRHPLLAISSVAPLIAGVVLTTTEPVAWGAALLAISFVQKRRHWPAVALLTIAALSRETAVVVTACCGLYAATTSGAPRKQRVLELVRYAIPGAVALAWYAFAGYLVSGRARTRFEWFAIGDLPTDDFITAVAILTIGLAGAWTWRDVPPAAWVALAFSLWILVYNRQVLDQYALARVNGITIVLGIAGVGRCVRRRNLQRALSTSLDPAPRIH